MVQEQQLPNSIKEAMERTPQAFQTDKAAGETATIQYKFTGAEPGNWTVKVGDGKCSVEEGETDTATVTINSPSDVWLKILRRELDGATAFMSGRLSFTRGMGVLTQRGRQ